MVRRALCGMFFVLVVCSYLFAQSNQFLQSPQYLVGLSPLTAAAGDLNGDGKPDIVVTNKADWTVGVMLGNGDGTFQPQIASVKLQETPVAAVMADINGDGKLDVVVVFDVSEDFAVLRGNGDGTLQSPTYYNTDLPLHPQWVAVDDLNGDGHPDVVVTNTGDDTTPGTTVSVFLNNGHGGFLDHVEYTTGNEPMNVAIADLNGDGKKDLAVTNSFDDTVGVLLGNGDGTFQPQVTYLVGSRPWSIVAADLRGSGKLDLVVGNFNDRAISILLNDGAGNFTPALDTYASAPYGLDGLAVADFNGDLKLDIAAANGSATSLSILLGNGDGTFQAHQDYWAGNGVGAPAVADFNGDGVPDVVVPDLGWPNTIGTRVAPDKWMTVLLGNGDGSFPSHMQYAGWDNAVAAAAGDFNNDGIPDMVIVDQGEPTCCSGITLLLGNSDGTYQPGNNIFTQLGLLPIAVAVGDFNNDGKPDVALANYGGGAGNTVTVLLANGDGTFTEASGSPYSVGTGPMGIATDDFNKDGKLDLVVINNGDNSVSVLPGNSDGTFGAAIPSSSRSGATAMGVGDFNSDGILDLAVLLPALGTPGVGIMLGNGDGTFVPPPRGYSAGANPWSLTVGDFNGDGVADVAVANQNDIGTISVLLGDGSGGLNSQTIYNAGHAPNYVINGDFNGDGKLDLLVSNYQDNSVTLFLNQGDGSFLPDPLIYGTVWQPIALAAADLNLDGALDYISVGSTNNVASVVFNRRGTMITLLSSSSTSVYGESFDLTSAVSASLRGMPLPTGNVNFLDESATLGSASLVSGQAVFTAAALNVGSHNLLAQYAGDGNFQVHTSTGITHTVTQAASNTALGSSLNPSILNQSVTFTATVASATTGTPAGTVTFLDGSTSLGSVSLSSGIAAFTTSSLTGGSHTVTASYAGDTNFGGSVSPEITQVVNTPDFSVSASELPGPVTVGGSAASTVTITSSSSFNSEVSLSCSNGLPAGASCGFNPASVAPPANSSATSTLTITAGNGTAAGSYTVTVSGASGSITRTYSTLAFEVNDFAVTAPAATSPSSINPGQSATATVTVTSLNGFAAETALSCSGLPNGTTCVFVPPSVTPTSEGATSTLTVNTAASTPAGAYNLSVSGKAGSLTHTYSTLAMTVSDFAVSAPASTSPSLITPGQSATATVTLTSLSGYSSPVALSCSGLPAGASCAFVPTSVTPTAAGATSALTVTSTSSTPAGAYVLSVTGAAGSLAHTYSTLAMTVGDFAIVSSGTSPGSIIPGQSATTTVTLTSLSGFASPVTLSCSGLPAGGSCRFAPASVTPTAGGAASTLTISTAASTPAQAYTLSVIGTYGTLARTYGSLVLAVGDFAIVSSGTSPGSITPGESATATVTLTSLGGFSSAVALSCSGLPSGASCTFDPASVSPTAGGAASTLTINTAASTPAQAYTLSVIGTYGTLTHTYASLLLTVGDFAITSSPVTPGAITPGQSATATVTLTSLGAFSSAAALSCSGLPGGASCTFNPTSVTPSANGATSTVTIAAGLSTPAGTYTISVTGTAGSLTHTFSTLSLGVTDFSLTAPTATTPAAVAPGQSANATVTLTALNGFGSAVSLACSGLPSAASCKFNPASVTPSAAGATSTLTIATAASMTPGSYTVSITGTSGTLTHTYANLALGVKDFAVSAPSTTTPGAVSAGQSATATITWTGLGGFSDTVTFTCSVSPSPTLAPGCAMSPTSAMPSAGGVHSTLTVTTTAATAALGEAPLQHNRTPLYALWLPVPGIALLGMSLAGARKRRVLELMLLLLVIAGGLTLQVACGGGGSNPGNGNPGTPAGAYTITVTGTSGSGSSAVIHSAKVTLTVQ